MVSISPSTPGTHAALEAIVERKLIARSQEEAHNLSGAVTSQMVDDGWVLLARSWVEAAHGGTLTLAFTQRTAVQDQVD